MGEASGFLEMFHILIWVLDSRLAAILSSRGYWATSGDIWDYHHLGGRSAAGSWWWVEVRNVLSTLPHV